MWELQQHGVPSTLICDSMAAQVMREGKIQYVIVGADRITARGDTANKIGTYGLAVLAKHHGIPFFVAAPSSTFDLSILDGADIPIEQRKPEEITLAFGKRTAPENVRVYNPAFGRAHQCDHHRGWDHSSGRRATCPGDCQEVNNNQRACLLNHLARQSRNESLTSNSP
jgi:eIF-2B alpha/beta/delta-like uncharacterized protein